MKKKCSQWRWRARWWLVFSYYFLFSCQNTPHKDSAQQQQTGEMKSNVSSVKEKDDLRPPDSYQQPLPELLTHSGENGQGVYSPDGKKLLFISAHRTEHEQSQVYEFNLSEFSQRRITYHDGNDIFPHYDPSGLFLVYSSTTDELKEDSGFMQKALFQRTSVKNSAGSSSSLSVSGGGWKDFFLSTPTAFKTWYSIPTEVYRSTLQGDQIERLSVSKGYDAEAVYHPNHPSLVWTSERSRGLVQLYLMNVNGKGVNRISKENSIEVQAQFHPSGHGLVFVRFSPDYSSSQMIYEDLKNKTQIPLGISRPGKYQMSPFWHPQGQLIVFSANTDDDKNFELYVINKDGSCLRRLTYNLGTDALPALSPDATKIVFTSNRNGSFQLYQMDFSPPPACPNKTP